MFDTDINSGFTEREDINISSSFTEITLLHQSDNGYSEVYKAKRFGQWHTLKCLTQKASTDVQYQTLLEKEFRIAYPLVHPNIIRTLGIEKVPELGTCIVQEYIDGTSCEIITREQAVDLCDAVAYMHKSGVVHRDIKPENILIRKDNKQAVLIDFGLADKADFSVLKGGAGTTGYAAPEQWNGELSPLVDIYGIGGVLLSNKHLARIASKCRKSNPRKRYQSAEAVKKALTRRFPWLIICIFGVLLLLVLFGVYYLHFTQESLSEKQQGQLQEHLQEQLQQQLQEQQLLQQQLQQIQLQQLQSLQQENSRLSEEIVTIRKHNSQLKEDFQLLENNYNIYKQTTEKKQRELEEHLQWEDDHTPRPEFGFYPNRYPSIQDQLY